ncbi:sll0787 family AIR synthase-like protein [Roseinatronobacter alkalisoli]|uniref:Sll0787 family AIR synthase-like protein n=1 Tax=Roseinatronobacter alkalisoli TaxID=3028235 RepID=A0ABT5TDD8_9RHOB|nr:sll0787 family AIR synthase-like protein [Roseinatronobacter sp. HJB301]MDD7973139.1 sll0787 family AIR synthase-like protein [Roseinatronobacter sp. HJB301]
MTGPGPYTLAPRLRAHPAIRSKLGIARAAGMLGLTAGSAGRPGDDAAMIATADGVDLLAGEGFIPAFVQADPWFAGWCGVMVNLSDIAAMGGRARALIDMVWAPDEASALPLMTGLRDAAAAYGVPLVGGHTNFAASELNLAVSVLGKATVPVTSFDARPGDVLLAAIDHRGHYVNFDNYCAALDAPHARLRGDLALLPELAEAGLLNAGKDISQGGIAGTALMLAECSNVAIALDLDQITPPDGVGLERWMRSFPSFGFLLSVSRENAGKVCNAFRARGIWASRIGAVSEGSRVDLIQGQDTALFWDYASAPYLSFSGKETANA